MGRSQRLEEAAHLHLSRFLPGETCFSYLRWAGGKQEETWTHPTALWRVDSGPGRSAAPAKVSLRSLGVGTAVLERT